ncbi:MAG: hypothetical protein HY815_23385 [Candidatus Riflebacteria bacterium]|nr:hypothetical protein [Candidatus Riflebacteria bacterium]
MNRTVLPGVLVLAFGLTALSLPPSVLGSADQTVADMESSMEEVRHFLRLGRLLEAEALSARFVGPLPGLPVETRALLALKHLPLLVAVGNSGGAAAVRSMLETDGRSIFELAEKGRLQGGGNSRLFRVALDCLKQSAPDRATLRRLLVCRVVLGEHDAALKDLEAAVSRDPACFDEYITLVREMWNSGDQDRARQVLSRALETRVTRPTLGLLMNMLRGLEHQGRHEEVAAVCRGWLARAPSLPAEVASPLWTMICEVRIQRRDVVGALGAYGHLSPEDRPWVTGGIVRLARALVAAGTDKGRSVLDALSGVRLTDPTTPAPLLRLAGELHISCGDRATGLRYVAASIRSGELEGVDVAGRLHSGPLLDLAPGEMTGLVAGRSLPASGPASNDAMTLRLARQVVETARQADVGFEQKVQLAMGAAVKPFLSSDADPLENPLFTRLANEPAPPQPSLEALGLRMRGQFLAPQRQLLESAVRGDSRGVLARLDGLSLAAWQLRHRITDRQATWSVASREPPPGFTRPIDPAEPPPAELAALVKTREAFTDPQTSPEVKMQRALEVAVLTSEAIQLPLDPIVIDLDGNGKADLSPAGSIMGAATFDLEGLGAARLVQWLVQNRDGWLCEDVDKDGKIRSGRELFGSAGGYADGFEKLALRDRDGDGVLRGDELAGLTVWRDALPLGTTDPTELVTLAELGITQIQVPRVGMRSFVIMNGRSRLCAEVWPVVMGPVLGSLSPDLDIDSL